MGCEDCWGRRWKDDKNLVKGGNQINKVIYFELERKGGFKNELIKIFSLEEFFVNIFEKFLSIFSEIFDNFIFCYTKHLLRRIEITHSFHYFAD